MSRKCVMCSAALPEIDKEIEKLEAENKELRKAIEEAKKAPTKEEVENIFDAIGE